MDNLRAQKVEGVEQMLEASPEKANQLSPHSSYPHRASNDIRAYKCRELMLGRSTYERLDQLKSEATEKHDITP